MNMEPAQKGVLEGHFRILDHLLSSMWLWPIQKTEITKMGCPGKWKHGPKPAVCPSDRFILSHTHVNWWEGKEEPNIAIDVFACCVPVQQVNKFRLLFDRNYARDRFVFAAFRANLLTDESNPCMPIATDWLLFGDEGCLF